MYCPARAHCRARHDWASQNALAEFQDVTEIEEDGSKKETTILIQPSQAELTHKQRLNIIRHRDAIIQYLNDIYESMHEEADKGRIPEGFKLVRKRTNRVYAQDESRTRKALTRLRLQPSDFLNPPTLRSPAQVETTLRAKGVAIPKINQFLEKFVDQPTGGTNLVSEDKPGRPVLPPAEEEFADFIQRDEDDDDLLAL